MAQKVSRRRLASVIVDRLVDETTDPNGVMRELAAFLVDNGMTEQADMLMNDIAEELFARTGSLPVEVTSAHALTDTTREQLKEYLVRETGADKVDLYESVDPDLVGGLVARTASAELDTSVRNTLRQLTAID